MLWFEWGNVRGGFFSVVVHDAPCSTSTTASGDWITLAVFTLHHTSVSLQPDSPAEMTYKVCWKCHHYKQTTNKTSTKKNQIWPCSIHMSKFVLLCIVSFWLSLPGSGSVHKLKKRKVIVLVVDSFYLVRDYNSYRFIQHRPLVPLVWCLHVVRCTVSCHMQATPPHPGSYRRGSGRRAIRAESYAYLPTVYMC